MGRLRCESTKRSILYWFCIILYGYSIKAPPAHTGDGGYLFSEIFLAHKALVEGGVVEDHIRYIHGLF